MKTFTDTNGATWTIALTIDAAKRVKGLLGVDVLELDQPLAGDLVRRGAAWCLCEPVACGAFRETFISLGRATMAGADAASRLPT